MDGRDLTDTLEVGGPPVERSRPRLRTTRVDGHLKGAARRGGSRDAAMVIREAVTGPDAPGGAASVPDTPPGAGVVRGATMRVARTDGMNARTLDERRAKGRVVAPLAIAISGEPPARNDRPEKSACVFLPWRQEERPLAAPRQYAISPPNKSPTSTPATMGVAEGSTGVCSSPPTHATPAKGVTSPALRRGSSRVRSRGFATSGGTQAATRAA